MIIRSPIVVGLDLSLTGLGMVAIPADWGCEWSLIKRRTLASDPDQPLADRLIALAQDVGKWVDWASGPFIPEIWIEGAITARGQPHAIRSQLKLAGAVEYELRREYQMLCETAEQQAVRKLLLGRVPQSDRKAAVLHVLRQMIPDALEWTEDELEAFAVANYGLAQKSAAFVTIAEAA